MVLPGIIVAIVTEGTADADLSVIDPFMAAISSVGDGDGVDVVRLQQVKSPPWFHLALCVGTGSLFPYASTVSINGPFWEAIPPHGGLRRRSTFSNIIPWGNSETL